MLRDLSNSQLELKQIPLRSSIKCKNLFMKEDTHETVFLASNYIQCPSSPTNFSIPSSIKSNNSTANILNMASQQSDQRLSSQRVFSMKDINSNILSKHCLVQVKQINQLIEEDENSIGVLSIDSQDSKSQKSDRRLSQESSIALDDFLLNSAVKVLYDDSGEKISKEKQHAIIMVDQSNESIEKGNAKNRCYKIQNEEIQSQSLLNEMLKVPTSPRQKQCTNDSLQPKQLFSAYSTADYASNCQDINQEYKDFIQSSKLLLKRPSENGANEIFLTQRCQSNFSSTKNFFNLDQPISKQYQQNKRLNLVYRSIVSSPDQTQKKVLLAKDSHSSSKDYKLSSSKKQVLSSVGLEHKIKKINDFLISTSRTHQRRNNKVPNKTLGQAILNYRYGSNLDLQKNTDKLKKLQIQDFQNNESINGSGCKLFPSKSSQFSVDLKFYKPSTSLKRSETKLESQFLSVDNSTFQTCRKINFYPPDKEYSSIDNIPTFKHMKAAKQEGQSTLSRVNKYQSNKQKYTNPKISYQQRPVYRNMQSSLSQRDQSKLLNCKKLTQCKSPDPSSSSFRNTIISLPFTTNNSLNFNSLSKSLVTKKVISNQKERAKLFGVTATKSKERQPLKNQQTPLREIHAKANDKIPVLDTL